MEQTIEQRIEVSREVSREDILNLLQAWINQRPGLEWCNYATGNWKESSRAYNQEARSIRRDKQDAEILLRAVALRPSITAEELKDSFRAFSGRLQLVLNKEGKPALDYCTGQYWPTEYRKAACAVLAMALWYRIRADIPMEGKGNKSAGDLIREHFRKEFGARLQQRWFD